MRETSNAQIAAVRRYEEKTYKRFTFDLRQDEDREIIEDINTSREHGVKLREWMNELFYAKPQIPDDLVSLQSVEEVLRAFRVDNVETIMEELKKRD